MATNLLTLPSQLSRTPPLNVPIHYVVEDLGDGMDRDIKGGVRESWLGRVSGFVAKEIVATDAAANAGFGKVGGFTVEVKDHVTGVI